MKAGDPDRLNSAVHLAAVGKLRRSGLAYLVLDNSTQEFGKLMLAFGLKVVAVVDLDIHLERRNNEIKNKGS